VAPRVSTKNQDIELQAWYRIRHTSGHPGAGGSLGFADPQAKVGFGYTMNQMGPTILIDPRATALIDAVYASL